MSRISRRTFALGAGALAGAGIAAAQAPGPMDRIALVIGMGRYADQQLSEIQSVPHDVEAVSRALRACSFDTTMLQDISRSALDDAIDRFSRRVRELPETGIGLLYFTGHAWTDKKSERSYVFAADARPKDEADYASTGLATDDLIARVYGSSDIPACSPGQRGLCAIPSAKPNVIIVFDACGIATSPYPDMLIAASTLPGKSAMDDSKFANAFARNIQAPGAEAARVFTQISIDVRNESEGRQTPRFDSGLVRSVVFTPGARQAVAPIPQLNSVILDDGPVFSPARQKRIALVVANELYPAALGALPGTQGDADRISKALLSTGFLEEQVVVRRNLNRADMITAFGEFYGRLDDAGDDAFGFLYFSGHGMADDKRGRNYLIPIDANITRLTDLPNAGILVDDQLDSMEGAQARAAVLVVDACRNTPVSFTRGLRGFAPVPARAGMLLGFATSPGDVARDDGLYGRTLADELVRAGQDLDYAFIRTNRVVCNATGQMPELRTQLPERVVLVPRV